MIWPRWEIYLNQSLSQDKMGEKHFLYGSAPQWCGFNFTPQWDCAQEGPPKSTSSSSVLQSCSPSYPASQRKALHLGLLHTTRTPHYAFCTTNMVKIPTLKPWLFCALRMPGFCVPAPGLAKCSHVYTTQKGKWIHPGMLLSTRMGAQHKLSIAQVSPLGLLLSLHYSFQS